MAKVKITGHASGSGVITVTAPNTSTDRTITLPDSTGSLTYTPSITDGGNANAITIDSSEKVGIGTTSPDSKLHVFNGDASITASADADDLIIENNGACGITIGSATNSTGSIRFADSGGSHLGMLYYSHITNEMRFYTAATNQFTITSDGRGLSQFTAKAWVTLDNGAGIQDSHNISSGTDRGVGRYEATFANAMANTVYCAIVGGGSASESSDKGMQTRTYAPTTTSVRMSSWTYNGSGYQDLDYGYIQVFGD